MKLMPIKQAQAKLLNATADKGISSLALLTFKKDRSVALEHIGNEWELVESGFHAGREILPGGAAGKRMVKEAFKREFPRSAKAYVSEVRV